MTPRIGALRGAGMATWLLMLAAPCARAEQLPCTIPDGLTFSGFSLPNSQAQLAEGKRLVVLVVGGSSVGGLAAGGRGYSMPARLEAWLRAGLPGKDIAVVARDVAGGDTRAAADRMASGVHDAGARLVVWETGSSAAVSGDDIETFSLNLESGINAAKNAQADIIVMDPQYAPSIARVVNQMPYGDAIRGSAEIAAIPLLPRSALMRAWSDSGELDLDTDSPPERVKVARKLYDCLAGTLATGIVGALH